MIAHLPARSVWPRVVAAVGVLGVVTAGRTTHAADFRVHTTVVAEGDNRPLAANLTIFFDRSIYDFPLDAPQEATIFDSGSRQFTLLDRQRGIQCRLTDTQLLQLTTAIQQAAQKTNRPQVRFAANPSFQEHFEPDSLRLTLAGRPLTYVAVGKKPQVTSAVAQYREFADWYTRLNATHSAMPPAARLRLNEALWKRDLVPEQISRRVPQTTTHSSRHTFAWRLEKEDRERVDRAQQWAQSCRRVSFDQFRKGNAKVPVPSSPR
jgi:hypothetical protein